MDHVTRVLAIRHGETAWNVDTRIQGQLDIPLNDVGRWRRREIDFSPGQGDESGESLRVFYDRCVGTAERLAAAHPGQTIALVAHGGVMDCLYRAASRLDLQAARSWTLGNASVNRLLYTPEGFTLVGWSDTSHLEQGSLDESNDRVGHAA